MELLAYSVATEDQYEDNRIAYSLQSLISSC